MSPACSSSSRRSPQPAATRCRRPRLRRPHHPSTSRRPRAPPPRAARHRRRARHPAARSRGQTQVLSGAFAVSTVRLARLTVPYPTGRRSLRTRFRVSPTLIRACSRPSDELRRMQLRTGSSSSSRVAGVPRTTRNNYSVRRSRSTAQQRKPPDGWPPPLRLLMCRGTRSISGLSMPRRGCRNTARSTDFAKSTGTNPGTTNCVPERSIAAVLRCTPTLRRIQGCSSE